MLISLILHSQTNSVNKIHTIIIDPGHGGKDPGTLGTKRYNLYEKDIALSVSLKLGEYIMNSFPDIEIVYTRDKDVFLELKERTDLANKLNADLFISIHCDGYTNSDVSGASVFVMGMSKLKANQSLSLKKKMLYANRNTKTHKGNSALVIEICFFDLSIN